MLWFLEYVYRFQFDLFILHVHVGDRKAEKIAAAAFGTMREIISDRLGLRGGGGGGSGGSGSGDEKDVVVLTDSNFEKTVIHSDEMWLVEFYAPWCGHCKSLAPHWASAATELKVAKLDATVEKSMAGRYGIQDYQVFSRGKEKLGICPGLYW